MSDGPDREVLLSIFLMEAWDTVAHLEDGIGRLRSGQPSRAAELEPLMVVTHRLKGAAGLHGFLGMSDLTAAAEQLLPVMPRLPAEDQARAVEFLADLVPELKRQLDAIGATGAEDADAAAAFRVRHPTLFGTGSGAGASAGASPAASPAAGPLRVQMDRFFVDNGEILEYFTPEAAEHLESMTTALLALEQAGRSEEELGRLFRAVHTLKGAALTVGCPVVGDLAHRIEDLLALVREGRLELTGDVVEAVFEGIDALRLLLRLTRVAEADADVDVPVGRTLAALDRLVTGAPAEVPEAPAPAAADAPDRGQTFLRPASFEVARGGGTRPAPRPVEAGPTIRVGLERLDALMNLVGELVIARSRLDTRLGDLDRLGQLLLVSRARMAVAVKGLEGRAPASPIPRKQLDGPAGGGGGLTPFADLFAELEFDRYDDVDILARSVAELSADITEIQGQLAGLVRTIREDSGRIQRLTGTLRDGVTRTRMVPVGRLFARFGRHVREAARAAGKTVALELSGEAVEVDGTVMEQVADPLLHLVQNAITHGIESEAERRAAGKPPQGTVRLSAVHRGGAVYVDVEDDGRGIDVDRLKEQAIRRGYVSAGDAPGLAPREVFELMFLPGFSTASAVTAAAGRGVGLDVVRTNLARLGGEIEVASTPGAGSRFTLKLPLTVVISHAFLLRAGPETFGVPLSAVAVVVSARQAAIQTSGPRESALVGDHRVPLYRLHRLLGLAAPEPGPDAPVVVVRAGSGFAAILVDEIAGKEEVVIKSLGRFLDGIAPLSGATISGDGRVILLLDSARLVALGERRARRGDRARPAGPAAPPAAAPMPAVAHRVLLVDDSVSVRKVVGHMLEKAGFQVVTANDGADALLQLAGKSVHVIVTDLEMPRVNGYELIEDLRRRPGTRELPVVVLTTRAGEKHWALARRLGVEHYVTKPVDETAFVQLIRSLSAAGVAEPALAEATR